MPRQARLDAPGVLQHVMARGIERRKIFWDNKDRSSFLERLAVILEETQTQCYAWALIPNHFHILLRTGATPLSTVMRRLMTGYAVTFNIRHRRSGHLFQNRYKSVICEEDPYLLELIRYIHLNSLRAKLAKDLKELDKYLFKKEKSLAEKTIEDVLLYFGKTFKVCRRRYRQFVEKEIKQGRRSELQGGGLIRSSGGDKAILIGQKKEDREKSDQRILELFLLSLNYENLSLLLLLSLYLHHYRHPSFIPFLPSGNAICIASRSWSNMLTFSCNIVTVFLRFWSFKTEIKILLS